MLRAVLVDVGGTLWPDRLTAQVPDDRCLAQLARLLPTLEPTQTLAALRAALREDDSGLAQTTHTVLGGALQRLGIACGDADLIAIRRALCAPASASHTPRSLKPPSPRLTARQQRARW